MAWQIAASAGLQALGGLLGSRSAKKAARAKEAAYRDASGIVDASYSSAADFFDPRLEQERAAMDRTNALLGLGGDVDYSAFRDTPGYQYAVDEGQRAIERSAAARGGLASGNTLLELQRHAQGMADLNFNSYLDRILGLQSQGVDNTLAQLMLGRGSAMANLRLGQGGAEAEGITGSTNALLGALSGGAKLLGDAAGSNALARLPSVPQPEPPPAAWRGIPYAYPSTYRGG